MTPHKNDRRLKQRFPLRREMRYRLLESPGLEYGAGMAIDASSGGIAFTCDRSLPLQTSIEVSISWPVSLEDSCPLRLVARGRVVRVQGTLAACTVEKAEFRTQSRVSRSEAPVQFATADRAAEGRVCV